MIHEPTYWSADCDLWDCKQTWSPEEYDHSNEDDVAAEMRQDGWIVVSWDTFCSLDHFLAYRADHGKHRRKDHSEWARHHGDLHHGGQTCCHGFHATNHLSGLGHDYHCAQYYKAIQAVRLAEAQAKAVGQ